MISGNRVLLTGNLNEIQKIAKDNNLLLLIRLLLIHLFQRIKK